MCRCVDSIKNKASTVYFCTNGILLTDSELTGRPSLTLKCRQNLQSQSECKKKTKTRSIKSGNCLKGKKGRLTGHEMNDCSSLELQFLSAAIRSRQELIHSAAVTFIVCRRCSLSREGKRCPEALCRKITVAYRERVVIFKRPGESLFAALRCRTLE